MMAAGVHRRRVLIRGSCHVAPPSITGWQTWMLLFYLITSHICTMPSRLPLVLGLEIAFSNQKPTLY